MRVETALSNNNVMTDINEVLEDTHISDDAIRSKLNDGSYLRAEKWSAIDDFQQFHEFSQSINEIFHFFARCKMNSVRRVHELAENTQRLKVMRDPAKAEKDRNKRDKAVQKVEREERELISKLRVALGIEGVEP